MPHLWEVFLLFAIPVGGGIPAGVILADKYGMSWAVMAGLYFISDVALAFVFEPIMRGFASLSRHSKFLTHLQQSLRVSTAKTMANYGTKPGPFLLIMIAFGVDPMTGRAAALAHGHGFLTGWAIAIAGDMIFFFLIMSSTLWLNDYLGDGTWTAIIIMTLMITIPPLIRRRRRGPVKHQNIP
jgi:uncharacterized membrane protein